MGERSNFSDRGGGVGAGGGLGAGNRHPVNRRTFINDGPSVSRYCLPIHKKPFEELRRNSKIGDFKNPVIMVYKYFSWVVHNFACSR